MNPTTTPIPVSEAKVRFTATPVSCLSSKQHSHPIQNLYDFTYALREHKPGDVVLVKVQRHGKTVEAHVTLTKRE